MKSNSQFRTRIIFFFVLSFAALLLGKLFIVQVVHSSLYSEKADRQYSSPSSGVFERGTIYFTDRDGSLSPAAAQNAGFKAAIEPSKILNKEEAYEKLSEVLDLDKEDFLTKASKEGDPYEEIAVRLSREEADAVSALKIPGVSIFKEKWRFYPGGSLASQTLGFVAYKGAELAGRYGLERQYDGVLDRNGTNPYVNFFAEVFSDISDALSGAPEQGDIVTSIEPSVQRFLEDTLSDVWGKYRPESVGGLIMNPATGEIYALGSEPNFDLNNFSKEKNASVFSNPLVEDVLEFGSVVKPLVMASALDAGAVKASTVYEDKGSVTVEKKEIFNFDKKARGTVNMQEVLNQSLNTGMVFVYKKLGREKMKEYLLSFGISEKTGVDLPAEAKSLVDNFLKSPREIEYANASFGQGIALTPVGMIRSLSSLGNGGFLVTPHVVREIKRKSGLYDSLEYDKKPVKISKETGEEITRMLVNVMDNSLGGKTKFPHYSVAAKTGTAQVADRVAGGYYEDRHNHSLFGYFPAYDPRFIIFLYAENPKGVRYAAETWSEPFTSVVKFLINYYEVPPDR